VLGHRFRKHPTITSAYRVRWEAEDHEVTFRADLADEYPDTLRLLTFGDPLFASLLREVPNPAGPVFGLARVRSLQPRPARAGWYRPIDSELAEIQSLSALRDALTPSEADEALLAEAQSAFLSVMGLHLDHQHEDRIRRQQERRSALIERGRRLLTQATYVWLGRRSTLFGGGLPPIGPSTFPSMLAEVKYPFAPLAVKVGGEVDLSSESPEWQEIATKNEKQLEGTWRSLEGEAKQLLQQLIAADDPGSAGPPAPPSVEVEAELV
jgi:hypothetical protein